MRYLDVKRLQELYRRMKYRNWIKSQLQQAGGEDYLKRLEVDIGAEPGHFRRELKKSLASENIIEGNNGAAGLYLRLPPIRGSLRKV